MKNYLKTLNNSLYMNRIIVSLFYLSIALVAIYFLKTPIEKVVATYIVIDIVAMFVMVGFLQHYKTNYLKESYPIRNFILAEGLRYLAITVCIYTIMLYASNYETYGIVNHFINIGAIIVLGLQFVFRMRSYRKVYMGLIKKDYLKDEEFEKLYLFNSVDDLKFEYIHYYDNFVLQSIEKKGIRVEKDFVYMDGIKYIKNQYFSYMKENEIKTLEDLTEEDRLLIAMINIQ